jgi:rubredoxin
MMSKKEKNRGDADLPVNANTQASLATVKTDPWLCPVCGLKRNLGNHYKCSKITQLRFQKERGGP